MHRAHPRGARTQNRKFFNRAPFFAEFYRTRPPPRPAPRERPGSNLPASQAVRGGAVRAGSQPGWARAPGEPEGPIRRQRARPLAAKGPRGG